MPHTDQFEVLVPNKYNSDGREQARMWTHMDCYAIKEFSGGNGCYFSADNDEKKWERLTRTQE